MCEYKKLIIIFLLLQIKLCWNVDGLYKSTAQRYKATEDYWLLENDILESDQKSSALWGETGMSIFTSSVLKIQAPCCSKMLLVFHQATQRHTVENQSSYSPLWEHSALINAAEFKLHRRQRALASRMWCSVPGCVVPTNLKEKCFRSQGSGWQIRINFVF